MTIFPPTQQTGSTAPRHPVIGQTARVAADVDLTLDPPYLGGDMGVINQYAHDQDAALEGSMGPLPDEYPPHNVTLQGPKLPFTLLVTKTIHDSEEPYDDPGDTYEEHEYDMGVSQPQVVFSDNDASYGNFRVRRRF
jgi:hypothetical protein